MTSILTSLALLFVVAGITCPGLLLGTFLTLVLLAPKLPVVEIQGYLVPVRMEDFFLAFAIGLLVLRLLLYRQPWAPIPVRTGMAVFAGSTLASTLYAIFVLHSVPDTKIAMLFWLRGLEYFAASLLGVMAVHSWHSLRRLLVLLVVLTALVGIYGVLQEMTMVPAFDAMHQISDEIVVIRYLPGFAQERLFSTFGGPYDLAGFYLLALPICGALYLTVTSRLAKFALVLVLALSLLCFYLTFARAPLLALLPVAVIGLAFYGKRPGRAAVTSLLVIVPAVLFSGFRERLTGAFSDPLAEEALGGRLRTGWADVLGSLLRSPVLGTGPASVGNMMGVDGLYALLLGMWGLLGLAAFVYLIYATLSWLRRLIGTAQSKYLRALAVGMFVGTIGLLLNGITLDVFFASKVAFTYWFLLGVLFAAAQVPGSAEEPVYVAPLSPAKFPAHPLPPGVCDTPVQNRV